MEPLDDNAIPYSNFIAHDSDVFPYGVEAIHEDTNRVELHGCWPNTTEGFEAAKQYGRALISAFSGYAVVHVVKIETPSVWPLMDKTKYLAETA